MLEDEKQKLKEQQDLREFFQTKLRSIEENVIDGNNNIFKKLDNL